MLGTPNAASGEAVKIGFVSDGRTASIDNSQMLPAAKATVEYLNAYKGGLAGRPIELIGCETAGEPGKATDCANQLVQDDVAMVVMPETQQPLGRAHGASRPTTSRCSSTASPTRPSPRTPTARS